MHAFTEHKKQDPKQLFARLHVRLLALLGMTLFCGFVQAQDARAPDEFRLSPDDRVLILAPHPDDETIACGGVIQRSISLGIPVRVVFLTYGDNNQWSFAVYRKHPVLLPSAVRRMGEIRKQEALNAAGTFGLAPETLTFLGYPDFGTLAIWLRHWGSEPPGFHVLTETDRVPYPDAFRPGALYKGEEILRDIKTVIRDFRPTRIFVSHGTDHNPDHQALYLFTVVALLDLFEDLRPELLPYLVHFRQWPQPKGLHMERLAEPPPSLASSSPWTAFLLQPGEVTNKLAALQKYKTQLEYNPHYLESFVRQSETFSDFPPVILEATENVCHLDEELTAARVDEHPYLTDEERARFIGFLQRSLAVTNNLLEIHIRLSRPLLKTTTLWVYAFGYRHGTPFETMPKIRVRVGTFGYSVFDQSRSIPNQSGVAIASHPRETAIRIPLSLLGNPDVVLTAARTYTGKLPLDALPWRVVKLPSCPREAADSAE